MPIGVIPALIMGAASAGGAVASSAIASHGAKAAAKTQSDAATAAAARSQAATQQATSYLQQGRAQNNQGFQSPALASLNQFVGVPQGGGGQTPPASLMPQQTPAMVPQQQMVTLQAPNGQTRSVPAAQAAHYISRGATVVR